MATREIKAGSADEKSVAQDVELEAGKQRIEFEIIAGEGGTHNTALAVRVLKVEVLAGRQLRLRLAQLRAMQTVMLNTFFPFTKSRPASSEANSNRYSPSFGARTTPSKTNA